MRSLIRSIVAFTYFAIAGMTYAAERGSADEAVAMVQKVIAFMNANGKEKAIAEVNNLQGQFRDRDLYISITDLTGKLLAHGANKRMQGIDIIDLKDVDGRSYVRERFAILKTKDRGWQDYKFLNPVTKSIEQKSMYFQKYGDVVVSCGIYRAN